MGSSAFHAFMRALGADGIEQLFINATDQCAVDQRRRTKRAIAEAIHRFDRQMTRRRGAIDLHTLFGFEMVNQILAAHGLTGFGAAEFDNALAGRGFPKVMIKGDGAVDFGLRHIQRVGDEGHSAAVHIAEIILQSVQDRKGRALQVLQFIDDLRSFCLIPVSVVRHDFPQ